jgi:thiol-disulfide isomerase/thioredoxin
MVRTSVLVLCVVVIGMLGCRQQAKQVAAKRTEIKAGEIGWHLPTLSAKDLEGRTITSADLRGKVVLVDFWATWCEPCKREMPGYQRLLDQYSSRGLVVIGMKANMMADTEPPLRFARKVGVHYPLIVADDDLTQKFGGIEGLPTTMIFDRNGILRQKVIGFEYTNVIESEIKPLL